MRKVDDGKKKKRKKKEKIMTFIVATNVIASGPPERRLTGMLTARAKNLSNKAFPAEEYSCLQVCVFYRRLTMHFVRPAPVL